MAAALMTRLEGAALDRLVARGLVMLAGVTPSDASHVLGRLDSWDGTAAEKALRLEYADVQLELARLAADCGEFERAAEHYARIGQSMAQAHYLALGMLFFSFLALLVIYAWGNKPVRSAV